MKKGLCIRYKNSQLTNYYSDFAAPPALSIYVETNSVYIQKYPITLPMLGQNPTVTAQCPLSTYTHVL